MDLQVQPLTNPDGSSIDMAQMMERIAVQRPYFAFKTLYRTASEEWDIWGDFTPEQPLGHEVEPLAIAEAGRHLAILGSCAAALAQPPDERVYYLAIHARWTAGEAPSKATSTSTLTARAQVTERSRKRVKARTELLFGEVSIGALQVEYQVLSQKLFESLFSNYREAQSPEVFTSPYSKALELVPWVVEKDSLKAQSAKGMSAHCAGHFPHYPMWPVAVVMYGLTQVLSTLLGQRFKSSFRFSVLEADVHAHQLVSGHESLTFCAGVKSISRNRRICRLHCSASLGSRTVAELKARIAISVDTV